MLSKRKPIILLALCFLLFGICELLSLGFLQFHKHVRPHDFVLDVESYLSDLEQEEYVQFLEGGFDTLLGWSPKPGSTYTLRNSMGEPISYSYDDRGARNQKNQSGPPVIATYGDSFTLCDEVNNDETWQNHLSTLLGKRVDNFGAGGYGTGQALLRFEKNSEGGIVAPITLLVVFEENINRVVNNYRPFYYPGTSNKFGFKPCFRLSNEEVKYHQNPNSPPVRDIEAFIELAKKSLEGNFYVARKIEIKFPYTLQAIRLGSKLTSKAIKKHLLKQNYLWEDPETTRVMLHLVDRFISRAGSAGTKPVLVFLPDVRAWSSRVSAPSYVTFRDKVIQRHPTLSVIDVGDARFDPSSFNLKPFAGHASPYGNKVIADHIFAMLSREIRAMGLR